MVPIHLDERDLAHLTSMIGMLERLFEREACPSSHVVFEPAYWRTRVESVAMRLDTPRPVAARASALLADSMSCTAQRYRLSAMPCDGQMKRRLAIERDIHAADRDPLPHPLQRPMVARSAS
jgi:hypothetical protein